MNRDDQLGVLEFLGQAGDDVRLLAVLLDQWTDKHIGAALLGCEAVDLSLLPLPLPCGQVRGVKALAAQQGTDLSGILRGIGSIEDPAMTGIER